MFRIFNAFQLTTLFAALPFGIGWLYNSTFPFSTAATVTACVVYIILYVAHIAGLCELVKDSRCW